MSETSYKLQHISFIAMKTFVGVMRWVAYHEMRQNITTSHFPLFIFQQDMFELESWLLPTKVLASTEHFQRTYNEKLNNSESSSLGSRCVNPFIPSTQIRFATAIYFPENFLRLLKIRMGSIKKTSTGKVVTFEFHQIGATNFNLSFGQ